jgi:PAS domain S-box-containing protein
MPKERTEKPASSEQGAARGIDEAEMRQQLGRLSRTGRAFVEAMSGSREELRRQLEERSRLLEHERVAHDEAEKARQQTEAILESISDGFFILDRERRFVYVNGKAEQLSGKSREELLGKNIWETFPQAIGTDIYQAIERAANEGVSTEFESASSVVPGWFAGRVYPTGNGVSVYFQDVTERKRAEEARARLAAIIESSDDAIIGKTLDGVITSWNKGAQKIYGYSAEEVVGKPINILVPPERPDEIPKILVPRDS